MDEPLDAKENEHALCDVAAFALWAAGQPQPQGRGDDLAGAIEHDLMEEGIRTVQVNLREGVVELSGTVGSAWERMRAEELALDHSEVDSVVNRTVVESNRSDAEIAEEVARNLRNYVHYSVFDNVKLAVQDGVVTLTGKVTWGYKAGEMAKMAARVPGVEQVVNQTEVLPVSIGDDQLRAQLASAIYGNSMFVRYSIQPVPPIHVVVENGKVTLAGAVASEMEKRKAGHIARQTFGVFSVENRLQVGSETSSQH